MPANFNAVAWAVYDLASAVCRFQLQARITALAEAASIKPRQVENALDDEFMMRCDAGFYPVEEMLDVLRERLDADLTYAHLLGLWSLAYEPDLKIINRISDKHAGAPATGAALLCNGSPLLEAAMAAYLPEVDQLVSKSFYSHTFRRSTAEPELFRAVGEVLAVPIHTLLYVSDDERARAAATDAGWQAAEAGYLYCDE